MKCASVLLFLFMIGGTWRLGRATCVLESDFGILLNCAFKKSSLFRIRNLGGVKAHASLGFSLGDELGFKESISNTEINRRRSATGSKFTAQAAFAQQQQQNQQTNAISVRSANSNNYEPTKKQGTTVPPFKPIPPAAEHPAITKPNTNPNMTPTRYTGSGTSTSLTLPHIPQPSMVGRTVPEFTGMPGAIIRSPVKTPILPSALPSLPTALPAVVNSMKTINRKSDKVATGGLPYISNEIGSGLGNNLLSQININALQSILAQANISESAFEAALKQKISSIATTTTTTTTTTTPRPSKHNIVNIGKVMNAPKEYYPVGYDKNFDDNFASRVELPETSFYCGDQKHFPGLYADEDLGCMVFHVCALTDDGLIMKSFLCPESTLFDQTILKCNWWFYVDCKNSKKLYDSNIPISKSYQLMKALTFFSAYKKDAQEARKTD